MTELTRSGPAVVIPDDARRERRRMRLYVLCQSVGWGGFLALQLVFYSALSTRNDPRPASVAISTIVIVTAIGLLLTHQARRVFVRRGWKELGWRALAPRLVIAAATLSLAWSASVYGYQWVLDAVFGPSPGKPKPLLLFLIGWVNGGFLLSGWLCLYFFYHLFDRFNRLEIEQLRLAAHAKEAELRALKSQVNPHFIFNSLNSLRALIDENPARAREAVTQLANLLRYSLQSAQAETVAFEDELQVVNDYLALEQVRHEERLRVRLDIAPDTLGLAVPPLLLQTLVENAVKYGISVRPEGGEIVIVARRVAGELHLRVSNPGELPERSAAMAAAQGSTGLGLKNAAERLRMFFGESARLQLRRESEALVVAEVSIPAQLTRA